MTGGGMRNVSCYSGALPSSTQDSNAAARYGTLPLKPRLARKRLNVAPLALTALLPWVAFCLVSAMLSFEMHYRKPELCQTLLIIAGVLAALMFLCSLGHMLWRRRMGDSTVFATGSWLLVLSISIMIGMSAGIVSGNRNFWTSSEVFYDVTALNSYTGVDPAHISGQELMDAGRIVFVDGAHLDVKRSVGFKNKETYCVAPITVSSNASANTLLPAYDFWAVGKGCCSSDAGGGDFWCGSWNDPEAHGGIRLMRDQDRAFYRLAVQQAQSAHGVKAVHPLFFHWVRDPTEDTLAYQRDSFKTYLLGMFAYFGFQLVQVYFAANCFSLFADSA